MLRHDITLCKLVCFFAIVFFACGGSTALAEQMQSGSFTIQSDSINVGGGFSSSASYEEQSTVGEVGTGYSSSTAYLLHAGFQQMHSGSISLTPAADVTLSPSIGGITGGTSNGSTFFIVSTDNDAGYTVAIKASSSPALQSNGDFFADYTPAGGAPDFAFSVPATTAEFGFTPEGDDIAARYLDLGGSCNDAGGSDTADACWDPLSTSNTTIVQRLTPNNPSGTQTTLKFRALSGSAHLQPEGVYQATTTITILAL